MAPFPRASSRRTDPRTHQPQEGKGRLAHVVSVPRMMRSADTKVILSAEAPTLKTGEVLSSLGRLRYDIVRHGTNNLGTCRWFPACQAKVMVESTAMFVSPPPIRACPRTKCRPSCSGRRRWWRRAPRPAVWRLRAFGRNCPWRHGGCLPRQAGQPRPDRRRLFALPFAHNQASCRVLEKAGYVLEGRLRNSAIKEGKLVDQLQYAFIAP